MKKIKDPIYGYISIEDSYMREIVDSAEFQRLRMVRQTSYESLFPNSLHNRFIHSLGVYHLGQMAFYSLKKNIEIDIEKGKYKGLTDKEEHFGDLWEGKKSTFELACLLHDVGHTPFSHTGEKFLLLDEDAQFEDSGSKSKIKIYNDLLKTVYIFAHRCPDSATESNMKWDFERLGFTGNDLISDTFSQQFISLPKANPHEIMSVIISLKSFEQTLNDKKVNGELFARMILGLPHVGKVDFEEALDNALIGLLNSNIIDVDKLDYLIRDMHMTGFESTAIDVERLLGSMYLSYDNVTFKYNFSYHKNALSIIENVVIAHDSERKWIQNHPVVVYDAMLIDEGVKEIIQQFKTIDGNVGGIFQEKALTPEGVGLEEGYQISLLNDADIIFLMKQLSNNTSSQTTKEYFDRSLRKRPIWKSEAEFNLILGEFATEDQRIIHQIFIQQPSQIGTYLNSKRETELLEDIEKIEKSNDSNKENLLNIRKRALLWLNALKSFSCKNNLEFDYYNHVMAKFASNIDRLTDQKIKIYYPALDKTKNIDESIFLYRGKKIDDNHFFYLYVKHKNIYGDPNVQKLFVEFLHNTIDKMKDATRSITNV